MQDLTSIYADIKNKIAFLCEPAFIYTGVGTAAGMRNSTTGVLDAEHYHQYPPLLQDIKNTYPALHLFIVLIDPLQEKPPHMIHDKAIGVAKNCLQQQAEQQQQAQEQHLQAQAQEHEENIYYDEEKQITVYTLAKNVTAAPYIDPRKNGMYAEYLDITNDLRDLNKFAIEMANVTTLYHDFTGRRNDLIAEYFDEEINSDHLDHCIYGLNTREDHGCYFNLTAAEAYLPFYLMRENEVNRISLFNIFKYIYKNKKKINKNNILKMASDINKYYFPSFLSKEKEDKQHLIDLQRQIVLKQIKNDFKNDIFSTMRVLLKLIRGEEKKEDITNYSIFGYIAEAKKRAYIEEKFAEGHYQELFDFLMNFFSKKMDTVVQLLHYDFTGRELIGFIIDIHEKDMYKWYNTLNYFLP
jgi:hypothetical protein